MLWTLYNRNILISVDSNDALYGSDEKFLNELEKMGQIILMEILNILKEKGSSRKQSNLMLDLFVCTMNRCDLSDIVMQKLAFNLWQQCCKHGFIEKRFMVNQVYSISHHIM